MPSSSSKATVRSKKSAVGISSRCDHVKHLKWDTTKYFDNNATTIPPRCVIDALTHAAVCGNPSSVRYGAGQEAHNCVESNRKRLAKVLRVDPNELVFTSGSTEANNTVISGVLNRWNRTESKRSFLQSKLDDDDAAEPPHVITTVAEHPSISQPLKSMEERGEIRVTWVPLDRQGLVEPREVAKHVRDNTALVCVIHAHGETGGINDIKEIARLVKQKNKHTIVHADCTQSAVKLDFNPWTDLGCHTFSASAHKLHGVKGIGVLGFRQCSHDDIFEPLVEGGPQERGHRAGTENVSGIASMAQAFEWFSQDRTRKNAVLRRFRDTIEQELDRRGLLFKRLGPVLEDRRMPHTLMVALKDDPSFCNVKLVEELGKEGYAVSVGSACSTQSKFAPPILRAMKVSDGMRSSTIRISPGLNNTMASARSLVDAIERLVHSGKCVKKVQAK